MGTPACPFLYLLTRFTPCMQCDTSYNVTRLMATLVHSQPCLTRACQLHVTEVFRRIKNSYRVHTHKRWRPTYMYKTMDTPKRVNIFNSTFRLSCSHHRHSWRWLQDSWNVELKMLTVFGVSIVLYFLKLLSGNRNFQSTYFWLVYNSYFK
jgi:hypothetical protein